MPRSVQLLLLCVLGLGGPLYVIQFLLSNEIKPTIYICCAVSALAFAASVWLVPIVASKTGRKGLSGKDLNKKGTEAGEKPIPESAGLAPGCVFLLALICIEFLHYYDVASLVHFVREGFKGPLQLETIAESWLVDYNAAMAAIGFMLFLGFADDVLDIRWRVKLILPLFASLPLVVAYSGGTSISIPKPLQTSLGLPSYVDLGILYYGYMVLLVIFCTNSINILAGVNGLEAGQTFIIACAVLLHNLLQLSGLSPSSPTADGHLFSCYVMLPLAAVTLGLLVHNWYPSRVFVGDTFTYFAGMCIAVAGILGHFSETLLLFLIPQVFNFVYSTPQLFGLVPCPRHRLPVFDPATGLLRPKDKPDWNLVNLTLQMFGSCTELVLCVRILVMQAACCALAFGIRYAVEGIYK